MSKNFLSIEQLSLTSRHRDNSGLEPKYYILLNKKIYNATWHYLIPNINSLCVSLFYLAYPLYFQLFLLPKNKWRITESNR